MIYFRFCTIFICHPLLVINLKSLVGKGYLLHGSLGEINELNSLHSRINV